VARVAMIINSLGRGGAETQFLRVARALRAGGWDVRILTVLPENDFADDGFPVRVLAPRPGPGTVTAAVRELRAWRPDAVINFLYQATLVGRFAARVARVPVVVSSMRNERLESRLRSVLYRATARIDDVTVTNSERAARTLEASGTVPAGRLRIIPNGVDLALFDRPPTTDLRAELGLADGTVLFVGAGRLAPQKDWPTLLAAVERYAGPPAFWAVAGEGAERPALEATIAARGLADRVRLLGLRDDVTDLLAAADALVLSSTYEGLPNIVLEAMAAGRPVVATTVGGTPELVRPETGLLVPPGDPAALSAALAALAARSPAERAAMGTAARDHVRATYSLAAADRRWTELLDGLVA
jgi:glycosyltransferase involved in cell wall biosynthesis